jgi:TolB protein
VAAAKATAGVVLSSDGVNVFFAEYAANTNGLYCPDGQTGQPAKNWPCMLDPAATGSTGSGHGRGMSAWGSQYWARGQSYQGIATAARDWRCILDHYYNANSNSITVDPAGTGSPGAGSGLRTAFLQGAPTYGSITYDNTNNNNTNLSTISTADGSGNKRLVVGAAPSWAPGGSQITYAYGGVWVINADGSGQTQIASGSVGAPAWSPLGDKIVYLSSSPQRGLSTMNTDGSGAVQIFSSPFDVGYPPSWSPNGTKLAFTEFAGSYSSTEIFTINADGSGLIQLTQNTSLVGAQEPSWSPDGTKIAFAGTPGGGSQWDIYVMNPDGSGQMPLTNCASMFNASCHYPRWSSDGKQIVFETNAQSGNSIYKMNSDGSSITLLLLNSGLALDSIDCSRCASFGKL